MNADQSRRSHAARLGEEQAAFNRQLGRRVRALRLRQDMTQEALADAWGVSRSSIANLETGIQAPNAFRLMQLAQALNCTICEIVDPTTALFHPHDDGQRGVAASSDGLLT